ncbi:MAG: ketol-acid reductoisomerase [Planctomycetota bacterium]|nr:ketol-acid reductoisomerase [Planctomycetota bacterium]
MQPPPGPAGVPSTPSLPFPRAIVEPEHVARAIAAERDLGERAATLPAGGEAWFAYRPGTSAVLFTAPHATKPMRNGELRFADTGTGSLALLLNQLACAPVLYTTMASPSDPNREDDNAFKKELAARMSEVRPQIVVDLHGSDPSRPYDVDFGTIEGRSLMARRDLFDRLVEALRFEGLSAFSSARFDATGKTITRWAFERGVPAIQLEISSTWISHGLPDDLCTHDREAHRHCHEDSAKGVLGQRFARVLQALVRFAAEVDRSSGRTACQPASAR